MADNDNLVPPPPTSIPPTTRRNLVPPDTPRHGRMSSTEPLTSTAFIKDDVFIAAANEMKGKFVGFMKPDDFLDRFLPLSANAPAMPHVNRDKFVLIPQLEKEPDMYLPLIEALEPFCKDITLVNTSAVEDTDAGDLLHRSVKPDISCYKSDEVPSPSITRARNMLSYIELKNHEHDEPFGVAEKDPIERGSKGARDTRGQLATYANAIQATQFRTHVLSVVINRSRCRFIHWTRSCAIVTEGFDYTSEDWLAEFFWRLSHAGDVARGLDMSVTPLKAVSKETTHARRALDIKEEVPIFKISVIDDQTKKTTYYIVGKPFTNNHLHPLGRGTRCFKALDCQTGAIVLLKDTWRIEGYEKEGDIYRELHKHGVSYIAGLVAAGDVGGLTNTCGKTKDISSSSESKHRIHVHYRLVLDEVGTHLTDFDSTHEMVTAVHCALIAHFEAVTKAGILHRDISVGNIIITDSGGLLIDWELSKKISLIGARVLERTGTWQFVSIRLHEGLGRLIHRVGDDLESFLWVLVWVALRHAQGDMTTDERALFLQAFDYSVNGKGGLARRNYIEKDSTAIKRMKLSNEFLSRILSTLWSKFGGRYGTLLFDTKETEDPIAAEKWKADLESHEWMLGELEKALKNEEWRNYRYDGWVKQEFHTSLPESSRKRKGSDSYPDLPKHIRRH
ncbi:hypothetical protein NLJ89_g7078 [Agrocybe chaxingu]|uniref:Fungal-type protein kinase domain-containing protein n=1 Tax=Agrocybe chaxingu TaxID=84603 RepID=A0A9W8JXC7_9AGAR|nr:hypothetical protein NLJ89_g7078 [Agrocybe chaxingu]